MSSIMDDLRQLVCTTTFNHDILDHVNDRIMTIDAGLYQGESVEVLARIVSDIAGALEHINVQSIERKCVSTACLVKMLSPALIDWIVPRFKAVLGLPSRCAVDRWFMTTFLEQVADIKMTDAKFNSFLGNADFVVAVEARVPWMVPCGIDALYVADFLKLDVEEKIAALSYITSECITLEEVKAACSAYQASGRVAARLEPVNEGRGFMDLLASNGHKLTETRMSDGYINVTLLSRGDKSIWSDYIKLKVNQDFVKSFRCVDPSTPLYYISTNASGSTWAHPKVVAHICRWLEGEYVFDELLKLVKDVPDDTVAVHVEPVDEPDVIKVEAVMLGDIMTHRRSHDHFVDASQLYVSLGKEWGMASQTMEFLGILTRVSNLTGIAELCLVDKNRGKYSYAWVHPLVAIQIVALHMSKAKQPFDVELAQSHVFADFGPGAEEYTKIRDSNDKILTVHRKSSGMYDANLLSKASGKRNLLADFMRYKGKNEPVSVTRVEYTLGRFGATWVTARMAYLLAEKGGISNFRERVEATLSATISDFDEPVEERVQVVPEPPTEPVPEPPLAQVTAAGLVADIKKLVAGQETSEHTSTIAAYVEARDFGEVPRDWYVGSTMQSLAAFCGDFKRNCDLLSGQSIERQLVSKSVLVDITYRALVDWAAEQFAALLPPVHPRFVSRRFMLDILQPVSEYSPAITGSLLPLYPANAQMLVEAERSYPHLMPCGINVLDLKLFRDDKLPVADRLTVADKLAILETVESKRIIKSEVEKACKAYTATPRAVAELGPGRVGGGSYVDVLVEETVITEIRLSDKYVNVDMLLLASGKQFRHYIRIVENQTFLKSLKPGYLQESTNESGTRWMHQTGALKVSEWLGNAVHHRALTAALDAIKDADSGEDVDSGQDTDSAQDADSAELDAVRATEYRTLTGLGFTTIQRLSDGLVDAGQLCKSLGKRWGNYGQRGCHLKLVRELSDTSGIPSAQLEVKEGNMVLVHPEIFIDIVRNFGGRPDNSIERLRAMTVASQDAGVFTVDDVVDVSGAIVSQRRSSDDYYNLTMMTKASPKRVTWKDFRKGKDELLAALDLELGTNSFEFAGMDGGTWAHPVVAGEFAQRCGLRVVGLNCTAEGEDTAPISVDCSTEETHRLISVTNRQEYRISQIYLRQIFGRVSDLRPVNPKLNLKLKLGSDEEADKCIIVKLGANGKETGRQLKHTNTLNSVLLDSFPTNLSFDVELRLKDKLRGEGHLYEGLCEGKLQRDTELVVFTSPEFYSNYLVTLVQKLIDESLAEELELAKKREDDKVALQIRTDAQDARRRDDMRMEVAVQEAKAREAEAKVQQMLLELEMKKLDQKC